MPERPVGLREDILEQVVGVLLVGGHVVDQAVKLAAVLDHKFVERLGVTLLGAPDKFVIWIVRVFGHAGRVDCWPA